MFTDIQFSDRLYLASYTHPPNELTPFPYPSPAPKSPEKTSSRSRSRPVPVSTGPKKSPPVLLACYMILIQKWPPHLALAPLTQADPPFMPFRDAGYTQADYGLTVQDVVYGVWKAKEEGILDFQRFSLEEYAITSPYLTNTNYSYSIQGTKRLSELIMETLTGSVHISSLLQVPSPNRSQRFPNPHPFTARFQKQ